MAIARFYVENGVQGVGYRPFILEQIFNFNLEGVPKNLLDGRVEVVVEGEKEDIDDFYEYLREHLPPAARNPRLNGIEFGDFHVADRRDAALALNLNQWNTAIPVVLDINKNLLTLGKETRDGFEKLSTEMHEGFTEMHEGFTEMHEGFTEMRDELKQVNRSLETLPERIARAFKDA